MSVFQDSTAVSHELTRFIWVLLIAIVISMCASSTFLETFLPLSCSHLQPSSSTHRHTPRDVSHGVDFSFGTFRWSSFHHPTCPLPVSPPSLPPGFYHLLSRRATRSTLRGVVLCSLGAVEACWSHNLLEKERKHSCTSCRVKCGCNLRLGVISSCRCNLRLQV